MTRLFCLSLFVALASHLPLHAQDKKGPPKHYTNSLGMKFVWIPPGSFIMGSPKEEKGYEEDQTQHKVTLTKGFYMGAHLVTQEQWEVVMGYNPSVMKQGEWEAFIGNKKSVMNGKKLPVNRVRWDECQEFAKKLREKDKKAYRLPTEAEWEYACRAGTTTPFHFGETISSEQANYKGDWAYGNGKIGIFRRWITPVDHFPANAWGLHDMHGNLYQWCQDWYDRYPEKDVTDPQGPEKGKFRVLRGGSWTAFPWNCRSASRQKSSFDGPGVNREAFGAPQIGLRLCFFAE